MKSPRGSLWKKWDLHIHTPDSLRQNYPGTREEAWSAFLADIEALPPEVKVIGINDYLFIDGYRRILQEREEGRLANIETVFPVIEMRLSAFGGASEHLKRVNFHVLFSDEISPDLIQAQFIGALAPGYKLSPAYEQVTRDWAAVPNRDSLAELGQLIIESVPPEQRRRFEAPLIEGFNNFNLELSHVLEILDRPHFKEKHLKGVGKTEWDSIAWGDNTIADKKRLINSVDFVFVAAESPERWARAQRALQTSQVHSRLLDCSDAHHLRSATDKDRIGNCWTWIKADTSFEGLRHALNEFDQRVFVGDEPELLACRRQHGSRYIDRISVKKIPGSALQEEWFDADLPINSGVVAIIGNKGTGKSAFAESIGVVGNTRQYDYFSFLNHQKFRPRQNAKASHFEASLTWVNGVVQAKRLDSTSEAGAAELVQFIPQNFLERVCNEIPGGEERDFDRELKRVIFSHVEIVDRLGQSSLDDLIEFKTRAREAVVVRLRADLGSVNAEIAAIESRLTDEYRQSLRSQSHGVIEKLRDLHRSLPEAVAEPAHTPESAAIAAAVAEAQRTYEQALSSIDVLGRSLSEANTRATVLDQLVGKIDAIARDYEALRTEAAEFVESMGWEIDDIVMLTVNRERLAGGVEMLANRANTLRAEIEAARALSQEKQLERDRLQIQLNAPHQAFQEYVVRLDQFDRNKLALVGSADVPDTLAYYRARRREWGRLPQRLATARARRLELVGEVYAELQALKLEYGQLYQPIQAFVASQPINAQVGLSVAVGLVDTGFEANFLDAINKRISGTFSGTQESEIAVRDLLGAHDLNTQEGAIAFVEAVDAGLHTDPRNPLRPVQPANLLRKGKQIEDLYDFLFGLTYLEPRYTLRFGEKDLHQLSPGEKGTLLLIFYLLVDKSDTPLVIDQPEDNLDNQTVFQVLVTCVREARRRRQIFLVTHNPNLAVVCDADQVIVAQMEKDQGNRIIYQSGALENPVINKRVVDILEGTRPAFDNRGLKYL